MNQIFVSTATYSNGKVKKRTHAVGGGLKTPEEMAHMIQRWDMYPGAQSVEVQELDQPAPATLREAMRLANADPNAKPAQREQLPEHITTPEVKIGKPIERGPRLPQNETIPSVLNSIPSRNPKTGPVIEEGGKAPNAGRFQVKREVGSAQQPSGEVRQVENKE